MATKKIKFDEEEYKKRIHTMIPSQREAEIADILHKLDWHEGNARELKAKRDIFAEMFPDDIEMLSDGDDLADSYRPARDF